MPTKITGVKEMKTRLRALSAQSRDLMLKAVLLEGEKILTDSKSNYVPIDLGTLKTSGRNHVPIREGDEIIGTITYGGAASAYAAAVHEGEGDVIPPSWKITAPTFTTGGVKYLERPLMAALSGMASRIAKVMREGLGK